jgi:hypothetical protein
MIYETRHIILYHLCFLGQLFIGQDGELEVSLLVAWVWPPGTRCDTHDIRHFGPYGLSLGRIGIGTVCIHLCMTYGTDKGLSNQRN